MNGNDINNMAQRYKDEMMQLYRKNTANTAMHREQNQGQNQQSAPSDNQNNMPSMRDIYGTPIPGVPGASYYGSSHQQPSTPVDIPVKCSCRFPSAEKIIESIASTPMPLPIYPEEADHQLPDNNSHMNNNGMNSSALSDLPMSEEGSRAMNARNVMPESIMMNTSLNGGTITAFDNDNNISEVLPDYALPADIPAESTETVPSTANFSPSLSWISLTGDDSWGFLQFNVYTADGAVPVPGALVIVRKRLPGGNGLVRVLLTNRGGKTPTIALPAPGQRYSQYPGSSVRPYSEYEVVVRANGYYTIRDISIPIFAGIKTVQPIDLIPLPQNPNRPQPRNGNASDLG